MTNMTESKVFNDSIHGHIELHPLLVKVIDTPQFQRLRNIKQLGCCYWVYPGAGHNRYEHSIGTCHLATKLLKSLKNNLELDQIHLTNETHILITPLDMFCVSLAALCHDLGHGPFSHLFDQRFMKTIIKKNISEGKKMKKTKFEHEELSFKMLQFILYQNGKELLKEIQTEFINENGFSYDEHDVNKDLVFIKELIIGNDCENYIGRPDTKYRFLYSIVSNKSCSVDVDKFDYITRDCHHLGLKSTFDHNRFIKFAHIMKVKDKEEDKYEICLRDKEAQNMYELFHMRHYLHKRAYQHKTCNAIEIMVSDALVLADNYLKFYNDDKEFKLSETINDMEVYQYVTDDILQQILRSNDINLKESKDILLRISTRKLYRYVGEFKLSNEQEQQIEKSENYYDSIISKCKKFIVENCKESKVDEKYFKFDLTKFNYGMGKLNPVDMIYFYKKEKNNLNLNVFKIKGEDIDSMLPKTFFFRMVRIYYTEIIDDVRKIDSIKAAVETLKKNLNKFIL